MKNTFLHLGLALLATSVMAQAPATSSGSKHRNHNSAKVTAGTALYAQLDSLGTGFTSQNFETTSDTYDNQGADDFEVPAGTTWQIDSLFVPGEYYNGTGPCDTAEVYFFADASGMPGAQIHFFRTMGIDPNGDGDFTIKLPSLITLSTGKYWVSVVARMDYGTLGQWGWTGRNIQSGSPAHWQNPGGGFPTTCTSWGTLATCISGTADLGFALYGCDGSFSAGTGSIGYTCNTEMAFDLNTLLSGAAPGGNFIDFDGTGALNGSVFDASAAGPGYYTFQYAASQDICTDTAYVVVEVFQKLYAGQGDTIETCNDVTAVNLWTGLSGYSANNGIFVDAASTGFLGDSLFNASGVPDGLYEFWYILFNPDACGDDTAFVYVNVTTCVGIANGLDGEVKLYPNPVNDVLSISTTEAFDLNKIQITGIQGKILLHKEISGTLNTLDLNSLTPGMYLIELTGSTGSIVRRISVR